MQKKILNSLSVFCGSSRGNEESYFDAAFKTGVFLADMGIRLVYGGARVGLMGAVADGALSKNGIVVGVIPEVLMDKEIAHDGLTELKIVKSMHERKSTMDALSDGAIVLPGGYGTMDEMFELLTWGQLGLHNKPMGVLNVGGFYDDLISCIDTMVRKNLLRVSNREMLIVSQDIRQLYSQMQDYNAPARPKWIGTDEI
jgi:uncharacterized protein (TIGR00730 family)